RNRHAHGLCRRLCELFSRRRHRRHHHPFADADLPAGLPAGPEARLPRSAATGAAGAGGGQMNGWVEPLLLPFQFPFMQQAFTFAILVVVPASILSCFLVLKGWALMGDAISHAVLPGMALAFLGGIPVAAGAFAAGMA